MEYFAMPREIHVMRDMKIVTAGVQIYNFDKNIMAIKCRDGDIEFVRRHPQLFDKFLVSIACKYNCPEIVKLICESIHDIDDICLQYACENDNYELVQYLLNYCIVCYEVVCQHENLPILKLLKPSCKYHDNMLAIAYAHGHDIMNFLGFAYLNYEIVDYLFTNFRIDLAINDFSQIHMRRRFGNSHACMPKFTKRLEISYD